MNNFEEAVLKFYKLPLSYDTDNQSILDKEGKLIADIRGWGQLQYEEDGEQLQDTLGEMLVKAFNEKYDGLEKYKPIQGGIHRTFNFYQEPSNDWYVDLPEWEGDKSDLQMVMGADHMLSSFAEGENKVSVLISEIQLADCNVLKLFAPTPEYGGGGTYKLYTPSGEYVMDVWLCKVTEFVFKKLPETIYVSPVRF